MYLEAVSGQSFKKPAILGHGLINLGHSLFTSTIFKNKAILTWLAASSIDPQLFYPPPKNCRSFRLLNLGPHNRGYLAALHFFSAVAAKHDSRDIKNEN